MYSSKKNYPHCCKTDNVLLRRADWCQILMKKQSKYLKSKHPCAHFHAIQPFQTEKILCERTLATLKDRKLYYIYRKKATEDPKDFSKIVYLSLAIERLQQTVIHFGLV